MTKEAQEVHFWLNQVKMLDQLINAKLAERERLMALATNMNANMDGMPRGNNVSNKVGNTVVKLVELANETDKLVDSYIAQRTKVLQALETLPPNEYGVLHRYYIKYMTWDEVAEDMSYSRMQVWRLKNSGLERLKYVIECYI